MPRYSFKCTQCAEITVESRMMDERDVTPDCEVCGGETKRMLDKPNTQVKGSARKGFYNSMADGVKEVK